MPSRASIVRNVVAAVVLTVSVIDMLIPSGAAAACPGRVRFEPTASATLDAGWTGIFHDLPVFGPTLDLAIDCVPSSPPCGNCAITGLEPDPAASWQRCANDTSRPCTVATEVAACGAAGTCRTYLAPPTSVGAGGLPFCVTASVAGPVGGTVDVESGAFAPVVPVRADILLGVYAPIFTGGAMQGCPRCIDDAVPNDGIRDGVCDAGTRSGLPCDGHATSPLDDFGTASFDCPYDGDSIPATTLDLGPIVASTGTQEAVLSAASPRCTANYVPPGTPCFCAVCNNAAMEPCSSDADCPSSGGNPGVCGGRWCLDGPSAGVACASTADCAGGVCGRLGEPIRPNACIDDTTTTADDCLPLGDGRGECVNGPVATYCSNAADRACDDDTDCDDVPGACVVETRPCFPDNGHPGAMLSVTGTATPPVGDIAEPTELASLACLRPTASSFYNALIGLPGLSRTHVPGRLVLGAPDAPLPTPLATATPQPTVTPVPDPCTAAPAICRKPVVARRSKVSLLDRPDDAKDRLTWTWGAGAATTLAELGDPTTSDAYALCVYDGAALRATLLVPAGGTCGTKPCWRAASNGFRYRNKGAAPSGVTELILHTGATGKARIQAKGAGPLLALPPLSAFATTLKIQIRNRTTGLCWGATYVPPFDVQKPGSLKDRGD